MYHERVRARGCLGLINHQINYDERLGSDPIRAVTGWDEPSRMSLIVGFVFGEYRWDRKNSNRLLGGDLRGNSTIDGRRLSLLKGKRTRKKKNRTETNLVELE